MILAKAMIGLPVSGETVFRLFMPNQHSADKGTSESTQANTLQPLREKGADVGHRTREVATADARP
ncbi:MAG: hypothetical protein AW09_000759 [Candidatus Accumulibacter phosphatis]|uniref:Uncharacterized protein n=1 Tax=Candidatus Accumulibacter phosphatis TaxID=327160 RepID=A0A080LYM5_9PROT|nr:MAG: hypothetical protein AW09_000759 [Candidatus Accumulibacter phosphatis]